MYSLLGTDQTYFYYTTEQNEDEDYKIKVSCNSIIDSKKIKSLILDCFDMDLTEFNNRLSEYSFMDDILDQTLNKPYLIQDRLEDVILV